MSIPSLRWQQCARALFVVLALIANLYAISVPLLHALAHEYGHRAPHAHGQEHAHQDPHVPSGPGDEHDEIHPASLHDECLIVPREVLDFAAALSPETSLEPTAVTVEVAPVVATSALHSRAPPRTAPARAPPLV
jgi:hypothetical protein